jgi:leucyl aminopeptidase
LAASVRVFLSTSLPEPTEAETVAVAVFADQALPDGVPEELALLLSTGEARSAFRALALAHSRGRRWLVVGLGHLAELTAERARVAAAEAQGRARELGTSGLCWWLPEGATPAISQGLVEGTLLAAYRFKRYKSKSSENAQQEPRELERLIIYAPGPSDARHEQAVARGAVVAEAANAARDLQNLPANDLTPAALGEHALELAAQLPGLSVEVEGREGIIARGMGAFAAVAQGSYQEPALITVRYEGPATQGPLLALVGKAVTFDSGGISLKPPARMAEMKFDMSGGAAVLEAVAAIARLELPVRLVAVVGATENLPGGRAVKPGDIVRAQNAKTIEVNNTDAEGRLVLADCLCHAVSLGAERIIDLATLTGAVLIALGSTYAGLLSNDDELAERVAAAGAESGEIVWRLPLHEEYEELVKGRYADLDNSPEGRKAGTIVGGEFLSNFVAGVPWAHLDIGASAWDLGRAYAPKGACGYGVRLLVELARSYAP